MLNLNIYNVVGSIGTMVFGSNKFRIRRYAAISITPTIGPLFRSDLLPSVERAIIDSSYWEFRIREIEEVKKNYKLGIIVEFNLRLHRDKYSSIVRAVRLGK